MSDISKTVNKTLTFYFILGQFSVLSNLTLSNTKQLNNGYLEDPKEQP